MDWVGLTDCEPLAPAPTFGTFPEVAFVDVQVNVVDLPAIIEADEAETEHVGSEGLPETDGTDGTVNVRVVPSVEAGVPTEVPENRTVLLLVKPVPFTVTIVPDGPEFGVSDVIVGAETTGVVTVVVVVAG